MKCMIMYTYSIQCIAWNDIICNLVTETLIGNIKGFKKWCISLLSDESNGISPTIIGILSGIITIGLAVLTACLRVWRGKCLY